MKNTIWMITKPSGRTYSKWNICHIKDNQQAIAAAAAFIFFWVVYGVSMDYVEQAAMFPAMIVAWGVFIYVDNFSNAGGISLKRTVPWKNTLLGFLLICLLTVIFNEIGDLVGWQWVAGIMTGMGFFIMAGTIGYFVQRSDKQIKAHDYTLQLFSETKQYEEVVAFAVKEIEAKRKINPQCFKSYLCAIEREPEITELKKKIIKEYLGRLSDANALFPKPADLLQKIYGDAYIRATREE